MLVTRQISRHLPVLVLSLYLSAQTCLVGNAQTSPAPQPTAATVAELPLFPSYAVAHDSLMRKAAAIRAEAAARQMHFRAKQGSFGGLHRRIKSYGLIVSSLKKHTVKYRYGIMLERVTYRDLLGRVLLSERYEGQQLTWLELSEYPNKFNTPASAKWLFVHGDYLKYTPLLTSPIGRVAQKTQYFYKARPLPE